MRGKPHGLELPIIFDIDVPTALYSTEDVTGVRVEEKGKKETKSRQVARCLLSRLAVHGMSHWP